MLSYTYKKRATLTCCSTSANGFSPLYVDDSPIFSGNRRIVVFYIIKTTTLLLTQQGNNCDKKCHGGNHCHIQFHCHRYHLPSGRNTALPFLVTLYPRYYHDCFVSATNPSSEYYKKTFRSSAMYRPLECPFVCLFSVVIFFPSLSAAVYGGSLAPSYTCTSCSAHCW